MHCALCQKPITATDKIAEEIEIYQGQKVHKDCFSEKIGEGFQSSDITDSGKKA